MRPPPLPSPEHYLTISSNTPRQRRSPERKFRSLSPEGSNAPVRSAPSGHPGRSRHMLKRDFTLGFGPFMRRAAKGLEQGPGNGIVRRVPFRMPLHR